MTYIPVEGTRKDVSDSDFDSVRRELDSVNFEISSTASTYTEEFETTTYISNLFKTYEEAKNYWEQAVNLSNQYHETMESAPLPEPPKEINFSEDTSETSSTKVSSVSTSNQGYYKGFVNIASGTLSVRNSPDGEIISNLNKGEKIKVLNTNDNGWATIELNGQKAYVPSKNIKTDSNLIRHGQIAINNSTERLYYKLEPNENSENYLPLMNEQMVNVLEYNEGSEWTKVEMLGKEVYVKSKYLKLD